MDADAGEKVVSFAKRVSPRQPSPADIIANPSAFLPETPPAPSPSPGVAPPPAPPAAELEEKPAETPTSFDDLPLLPGPGDAYKAHARPASKPVPTLHVLLADGTRRGFSWGNYDSIDWIDGDKPGDPSGIVLRFAGMVNVEVIFAGTRTEDLYNYLSQLRIVWVRVLPKGKFADPTEPAITGVVIRPVAANPYLEAKKKA